MYAFKVTHLQRGFCTLVHSFCTVIISVCKSIVLFYTVKISSRQYFYLVIAWASQGLYAYCADTEGDLWLVKKFIKITSITDKINRLACIGIP